MARGLGRLWRPRAPRAGTHGGTQPAWSQLHRDAHERASWTWRTATRQLPAGSLLHGDTQELAAAGRHGPGAQRSLVLLQSRVALQALHLSQLADQLGQGQRRELVDASRIAVLGDVADHDAALGGIGVREKTEALHAAMANPRSHQGHIVGIVLRGRTAIHVEAFRRCGFAEGMVAEQGVSGRRARSEEEYRTTRGFLRPSMH
mmetsp:Transcript_69945/g.202703  ORF Transcript_69945/g.202703 Transcript_69945/m.202703 type:complete len:204 (-) Transcript_69945:570-1181(-)